MRIGIDARMINATGIGRYTKSLIENLAEIDSSNQYFLFLKKKEFNSLRVPSKIFKKVLADFHWYGLSEQLKFPKIINKHKLDIMHFPHFNIPIFYRGNFVVTIHDLTLHKYKTVRSSTKDLFTYQLKHFMYKLIIKKAVKSSKKIICPSQFSKRDIIEEFGEEESKIVVTLEGGPSEKIKNIKPDNSILEKNMITNPFVFYVGNAYPHKNLDLIINAIRYLPGDIKIVFAGKEDEFYKKLKIKVTEKGLKNRIIFTDFVTDEELVSLYKNADAYIFPSLNEGFGLPPLEAINFGLPPIVANSSCLLEILGDAAIYFDPSDANELADSIKAIVNNKDLRNKIVENGKKQIEKYSWKKMAKETINVYKEALNGKNN